MYFAYLKVFYLFLKVCSYDRNVFRNYLHAGFCILLHGVIYRQQTYVCFPRQRLMSEHCFSLLFFFTTIFLSKHGDKSTDWWWRFFHSFNSWWISCLFFSHPCSAFIFWAALVHLWWGWSPVESADLRFCSRRCSRGSLSSGALNRRCCHTLDKNKHIVMRSAIIRHHSNQCFFSKMCEKMHFGYYFLRAE